MWGVSSLIRAGSGGVVYLSDEYASLSAGSETRDLFEGVNGAPRPSQRPDRLEGGVVVGFDAGRAEACLGR